MFSVFSQKGGKSKNRRKEEVYMDVEKDMDALIDLGMSQEDIARAIKDLDCMNPDRDDSCAAAAAAPATFDDDDMI